MKKLFILLALIPTLLFGQTPPIYNVLGAGNNANGRSLIGLSLIGLRGPSSGTVTVQAPAVVTTYTFTLPANDGTSGQILQTDGNGVATWETNAASTLTVGVTPIVSGTASRLLFESSTNKLGSSLIEYTTSGSYNFFKETSGTRGVLWRGTTDQNRIQMEPDGSGGVSLHCNYTAGGATSSSLGVTSTGVTMTGSTIEFGADLYWHASYYPYDASTRYGIFDFSAIATSNKTFTWPNTSGTVALTSDISAMTLSQVLANGGTAASADLKNVMSDETGSGALVFGSSATLADPSITSGLFTTSTVVDALKFAVTTTPATPADGFKIWGTTNQPNFQNTSGFSLGLAIAGLSADRIWTVPNSASTFVGTDIAQTLSSKTLASPTITTTLTLDENASVVLNPALSADGKYTGTTIAGTAGATLAFGDIVYLAAADSRWELTDADAAATSGDVLVGICVLAAASDGDPTTIMLQGTIRADANFPALTIGAPVHISTTAGDVQVTAPSGTDDVVRRLGFAITADAFYFNPSNDYITIQ